MYTYVWFKCERRAVPVSHITSYIHTYINTWKWRAQREFVRPTERQIQSSGLYYRRAWVREVVEVIEYYIETPLFNSGSVPVPRTLLGGSYEANAARSIRLLTKATNKTVER
jgi:hypothetical protein